MTGGTSDQTVGEEQSITSMGRFLNRVICGDSAEILKDVPSNSINTVVTSPPYFNQRNYGVGMGSEHTLDDYLEALVNVFSECVRVTRDDGSLFINMGDKYVDGSLVLAPYAFAQLALKKTSVKLINQITWVKPNPEPRQFKRRLVCSTEPIFHFVRSNRYRYFRDRFMINRDRNKKGRAGPNIGRSYFGMIDSSDLSEEEKQLARQELEEAIREVQEGKIWSFRMKIRGIHSLAYGGYEGGRREHLRKKGFTIIRMYNRRMKRDVIESPILQLKYIRHPAIYPEKIVEECLNLTTEVGDTVLDPFLGSGTTASVAKRMGRNYVGIDINEEYCAVARDRIESTLVEPKLTEFSK